MNGYNLPISCWAKEDIPSNKAENMGFDALTNAELLSILIGSGSQDCNAIETSRIILNMCGNNLHQLSKIQRHELAQVRGLGKQKTSRIMAAMELGRRRITEYSNERPDLGTATRIYNHYYFLRDNDTEEFWVSILDQHYNLIKDVKIGHGGLTEVSVDVRIIMREACLANGTMIVAVHNHPSGNISPSKCDEELTQHLCKACKLMCYNFVDHVIIGDGVYYSFKEQGKI